MTAFATLQLTLQLKFYSLQLPDNYSCLLYNIEMDIKDLILKIAAQKDKVKTADIVREL